MAQTPVINPRYQADHLQGGADRKRVSTGGPRGNHPLLIIIVPAAPCRGSSWATYGPRAMLAAASTAIAQSSEPAACWYLAPALVSSIYTYIHPYYSSVGDIAQWLACRTHG